MAIAERTLSRSSLDSGPVVRMGDEPELTLVERTKIQAEVLIPVVRAMEEAMGREPAHRSQGGRCPGSRPTRRPRSGMLPTALNAHDPRHLVRSTSSRAAGSKHGKN
jgi:hypothetical protein